jgi:16S rRNA (guanine966-N2)-methyltransferase
MVRVIAGSAKGRKLKVPDSGTRPLTDRIKTTIFDLIRDLLPEAKVLDLFAGSGGFGIEALSRGAKHATFIDLAEESIDLIKENLQTTGFTSKAEVIKGKLPGAITHLNGVPEISDTFDIVFVDPPFTQIKDFNLEDYSPLITKTNIFVMRLPSDFPFKDPNTLYKKHIGESTVYFLRRQ